MADRTHSERINFGKLREVIQPPNLIEIQITSYLDFLQKGIPEKQRKPQGLEAVFREVFPILSYDERLTLEYVSYNLGDPKSTELECLREGITYSVPLYVKLRLREEDFIKDEDIYMGEIPMVTERGSFIINGAERVVVSQLVRSPGVYFERTLEKLSDKDIYTARIIPSRGAWLEFEIDKRDQVGVRIDRKRKQSVTVFLKALGMTTEEIREAFAGFDSIEQTLEKDAVLTKEEALKDIYRKLRPGEQVAAEAARALLDNFYFNPKRYDLAKVGRYKVNRKLGVDAPLTDSVLTVEDIVATIRYMVSMHEGRTTMPGVRDRPVRTWFWMSSPTARMRRLPKWSMSSTSRRSSTGLPSRTPGIVVRPSCIETM